MASAFLVIPVVTPYLVFNLRFPGKDLKWIYMIGGALLLRAPPLIGALVIVLARPASPRSAPSYHCSRLFAFVRYDPRVRSPCCSSRSCWG